MRFLLSLLLAWFVAGSVWAAPLRVASINVEWGIGASNTVDFNLVARDLERIGADVVAFQELVSDVQNIQALGARLGLPYFLATNSSSMNAGVLSRYPFRSQEWISTGWGRAIPLVRPDVPGVEDDPWIAVVHLKCCGNAGGREQQTRAAELYNLQTALSDRGIQASSQVVILGDFNLVSDVDATYGTWPTFAPASADGYFPNKGILKLPLRHADGFNAYTWRGNSQYPPRDLDHIMLSAPLRDRNPGHEIYEPRNDSLSLAGRPKFGDRPGTLADYASDHLPIFTDLIVRDANDGFPNDTIAPAMAWAISPNTLIFLNQTVACSGANVTATDNLDPAPVVSCYPLNPTYTTVGTKKITYMARDRHGNTATLDRTVTVADWGQGGLTHNLQWPPTMQIPVNGQGTVYAQIQIPGWTETVAKVAPNVRCWVGIHTQNTDPSGWPTSAWKEASLNSSQGVGTNADEYILSLRAAETGLGVFYYAVRWQINGGNYGYGGITAAGSGGAWDGTTYAAGVLTVGSTIGNWSSNAPVTPELVGRYAIGGASSLTATDGVLPSSTVSGGNLVLTAIVRTDDTKLAVVGEAVTSLANYAPGGTVSTVNGVDTADQTGVPSGCKRQTFTVAQGADSRKFLRLKATLAP